MTNPLGVSLEEWLISTISMHSSGRWNAISLVVGPAGCGKTTALKAGIEAVRSIAPPREVLLLSARAGISPAEMLKEVLSAMGEQALSRTITDLTGEVTVAIEHHGFAAIVIDQAEGLQRLAFDIWRALFDKTGCLLVFAGRPSLLDKLRRDEQLWSRVGRQMVVSPPSAKVVIEDILPRLDVPGFRFDPAAPEDHALGEALWHLTRPSLRDLQHVLQEASEVARASCAERVGLSEIHWAFGRVVEDKPRESWARLMWAVAVAFLHDEYKDAHMDIKQEWVTVNGMPVPHWWWVVQAGDVISSQASETKTHQVTLQELHLRRAQNLLQRIARLKPGGREPYL